MEEKLIPATIEELIAIANTEDPGVPDAQVDSRVLKDIENFITASGIKTGAKKVHSLVVYALYREWQLTTTYPILSRTEFIKGFSYFFQKFLNSQNGVCFKLSPKLSNKRRFDCSDNHLKECRNAYGKKKKINEEIENSISGSGQECQPEEPSGHD